MAALALKSGVHTLVATSHANTGGFFKEYSIEEYLQRLEAFRKALDEVKLPLRVFSGMEIYMTREVPRMIREGRLLSLNQTGYFLTEFSFGIEQEEMDEMLHDLMELGVTPVIAHPERYPVSYTHLDVYKRQNKNGLQCQYMENKTQIKTFFFRHLII